MVVQTLDLVKMLASDKQSSLFKQKNSFIPLIQIVSIAQTNLDLTLASAASPVRLVYTMAKIALSLLVLKMQNFFSVLQNALA
jgi:hypothetical protein